MEAIKADHLFECGILMQEFSSDVNDDLAPLSLGCGHTFSRRGIEGVRSPRLNLCVFVY